MNGFRAIVVVVGLLSLTSPDAGALPTIDFGNGGIVDLVENRSSQRVRFYLAGAVPFDGLELNLQVGDGGAALGGSDIGPVIIDIELVTDTIFATAGAVQTDVITYDLARQSIVDASTLVSSDGAIATVTFSTVGLFAGEYDLLLTGIAGSFDTTLYAGQNPLNAIVPNGTIRIGPTPNIGDYDRSGDVGQGDLDLVLAFWGTSVSDGLAPGSGWLNPLDITGNLIGQDELARVLQHWGQATPLVNEFESITGATGLSGNEIASLIPEPASLALVVGGMFFSLCRPRRSSSFRELVRV